MGYCYVISYKFKVLTRVEVKIFKLTVQAVCGYLSKSSKISLDRWHTGCEMPSSLTLGDILRDSEG